MNPSHNGTAIPPERVEDAASASERENVASEAAPTAADTEVTTPTWSTRADALESVRVSSKPMALLGVGLAAAVTLFVLTTLVGKRPARKAQSPNPGNTQASVPENLKGSVTPLMESARNPPTNDAGGQLTPADIDRTKTNIGSRSNPVPPAGATLASVPPFDSTQQHWEEPKPYGEAQLSSPGPGAGQQENLLKEASLVFVKRTEPGADHSGISAMKSSDDTPRLNLTPGTRIQARLETQVSSAVTAPVVAVVEYTYSLRDHVVIPAGARFYGQLEQADRSGAVSIKFNEIEVAGERENIEAIGASLDMGPIKGIVYGKNTGKNFLVRSASGIGSVAAMLVGNNTSEAFSEDDLIRQRIAENAGNAGDTEIMNMALTSRIVVSVPSGTPIYIIFTKRDASSPSLKQPISATH